MPIFSFNSSAAARSWMHSARTLRHSLSVRLRQERLGKSVRPGAGPGSIGAVTETDNQGYALYPVLPPLDRRGVCQQARDDETYLKRQQKILGASHRELLEGDNAYGAAFYRLVTAKAQLRGKTRTGYSADKRDVINRRLTAAMAAMPGSMCYEPPQCEDCDNHLPTDNSGARAVSGGRVVCHRCFEEYRWATDTRQYIYQADAHYCEVDDNYYEDQSAMPSRDYDDDDRDCSRLADYHDHPRRGDAVCRQPSDPDDPEAKAKNPIRLGFEWEVECDDPLAAANKMDSQDLPMVGEADGSISDDYGVEVVSGWSTLHTVLGWIDKAHGIVDPTGTNNCGLHVNVSGLTPTERVRLHDFYNETATANLIRAVAGRYNVDYAFRRTPYNKSKEATKEAAYMKRRGEGRTDKYSHVNTYRYDYCEIRVFASSTNLGMLRARLQFAWATCEFVRSVNSYTPLTTEAFILWFNTALGVAKACPDLRRLLQTFGAAPVKTAAQIAESKQVAVAKKGRKPATPTVTTPKRDVALTPDMLRGVSPIRRARLLAAARASASV